MSILESYTTYRDRAYTLLNEFFPVQHSLDVLTGEVDRTYLDELAAHPISATVEAMIGPGDEDEDDEEEEDDEFGDG